MKRNKLKINVFVGLSYFLFSLFGSLISADKRVDEFELLNISLDATIRSCQGEIVINPQGGIPPYAYSWESRATGADPWQPLVNANSRGIIGAAPGEYRVTVTDQSNPPLQGVGSFTLSPPTGISATTYFQGLICSAEPNSGLVLLAFDNGIPDYIWQLIQGTTVIRQGTTKEYTIAFENLAAGTYTLNWSDSNNCTGTKTITIAGPPSPLTGAFTSQNITCSGETNGLITVTSISGGWSALANEGASYLIRILRNGVEYRPWGPAQANYTNLPAGQYTLQYTDKINRENGFPFNNFIFSVTQFKGCEKSASFTITEPAPLSAPVTGAICQGSTDGFLSLVPTGGIPPYQVDFFSGHFDNPLVPVVDPNVMNSIGQQKGLTSSQTVTQNGLAAGKYAIKLIDANGCLFSKNLTLIENPSGQVNVTADAAYCAGSPVSVVFATANSGGITTYAWTNTNTAIGLPASGQGNISFNSTNATTAPIQGQITVTPIYTENGVNCPGTPDVFVIQVNPTPFAINGGPHDFNGYGISCFGANDGYIEINLPSQNLPADFNGYVYTWTASNGGVIAAGKKNDQNIYNLVPGTYTVTVGESSNTCRPTKTFVITEPLPIAITETISNYNGVGISCFGASDGSIKLTATGGTRTYSYLWTASNGGLIPAGMQTTSQLTGIPAGTYTVRIIDSNGCVKEMIYILTQPAAPVSLSEVDSNRKDISCYGEATGNISVMGSGGIRDYIYTITGTDYTGATVSLTTGLTNLNLYSFSTLKAGNYILTLTDLNRCQKSLLPITLTQPAAPLKVSNAVLSNYNGFQISCKGGSDGVIDLTITGGNGNYKFFWEGPGGFRSNLPKIEKLVPGKYEVTVIDSKNCSTKASYDLVAPDELLITKDDVKITDVSCFDGQDGTLTVTIKKASVGPSRYELSGTSVTGLLISETILSSKTSHQFTVLRAGSYTLRVFDANGCASNELSGLVVNQPSAALGFTILKTDNLCYRANNGTIRITPTGGTAPYTILWSNLSQAFNQQNLAPGPYTATLTDAKGCTIGISTEIKEAPIYDLTETVKNISCFGKKDGSIQLNIIGGKAPQKVQWAHGPQEPTLNNLDKGVYSVVITDANGCKIERQFVINEPQPLDFSSTVVDALDCVDPNSGSINITPFGGTPPYTYNWSNGSKAQNLSSVGPSSYSLELVDASGCRILKQFTVTRPLPLEVSVAQTTERVCNPRGLKSNFKVTVKGGIAPYTVTWNRGTATNGGLVMDTQELGVFIVTVKDARGCIQTKRMEVIETNPLILEFDYKSASFDFSFENLVNFEVQFKNLSVGKYKELSWDFGDGGSSLDNDPKKKYAKAGTYTVELKLEDLDACVVTYSKEIVITDYFLKIPNVFTPNEDGVNDHFNPKFIFIQDIHVTIINNWGELVYESKDLDALGWDGLHNGERATIGNYVCRVRHTTLDGRVIDQSSVFYLGR
jgi:large repetitive protein